MAICNDNYKIWPALAAYIDRVSAEQVNFRKFQIREHRENYYVERVLIKLSPSGVIECSDPAYDPTKEEAKAIEEELAKVALPVSIRATMSQVEELKRTEIHSNQFYIFHDRKNGGITMCQERIDKDNGQKAYVPWTFFSDGNWRRMEPDGSLPFWKPEVKRSNHIMIHEGAKAAAFAENLITNHDEYWRKLRAEHPWAEELSDYEHWGIIGGALALHRADYEELRREKATEVVYFCDNDRPGKTAVEVVSEQYGKRMKCVKVDDKFPVTWDIADPMPRDIIEKKEGIRLSMSEYIEPATWAIKLVTVPGVKKRVAELRQEFATEWLHCIDPEKYVHKEFPNRLYSADTFNNLMYPFGRIKDVASLVRRDSSAKVQGVAYNPAHKPGVYIEKGKGSQINTHIPTDIKPIKGDETLWLEFMNHLIPSEKDRDVVFKWCATLIARPESRMSYALLLVSDTQGVGKTTLGEKILKPLLGAQNVSFPNERQIVESTFNGWVAHKRLAVVNEIYAGNSSKAYNSLKSYITDDEVEVNEKYQSGYTLRNWLHIFACSNSERALKLDNEDRRWFVPAITEDKRDNEYWDRLNMWLIEDDGLGIIKHWADEYVKKNGYVRKGERAPDSDRKKELAEATLSAGQLLIKDLLEDWAVDRRKQVDAKGEINGKPIVTFDEDLVEYIKYKIYDGRHSEYQEKQLTIRKLARQMKWFAGKERVFYQSKQKRVITTDQAMLDYSGGELKELADKKEIIVKTIKTLKEQEVM